MNIFIFALLPLIFIADRIALRNKKFLFSFYNINVLLDPNNSVNAYVIGNNLVLTRGFLNLSIEEQRAILAHEFSHMILNHYKKTKTLLIITIVVSLLLYQINIFSSLLSLILALLFSRYLSRKQEIEADKLAYRVVGKELKSVIEKYGDSKGGVLSSHPSVYTRLKMLNF